jgi:hypothetical protein
MISLLLYRTGFHIQFVKALCDKWRASSLALPKKAKMKIDAKILHASEIATRLSSKPHCHPFLNYLLASIATRTNSQ